MSIPDTMRAAVVTAYDGRPESLTVEERPVPRPGPGEVLVRLAAAPINPSDLMFLRGTYGVRKPLPAVPGFEGMPPVFGTAVPLKGLSGVVRRYAYSLPDHYPSHWLLKMLGDRIDSWGYRARRALPVVVPFAVLGFLARR